MWRAYRKLVNFAEVADKVLFEEILALLSTSDSSVHSQFDVEWFGARAWNFGVSYYRRGNIAAAEVWMSLAMKIVKIHLESSSFHDQMVRGYKEILLARGAS
mmetsp:Transcript_35583/g.55403  ORF Transcript_35583/g.55403 Transcript_35583/m.55403 type:complete len:102 (+) Transcript_35583:349-654(+)